MIRGKIIGERIVGIMWVPYDKKISFLGFTDKGVKKLKNQKNSFFSFSSAEAFVCENCGKLIAEV